MTRSLASLVQVEHKKHAVSISRAAFDRVVIVRAEDAEEIAAGSARVRLLADSSATGGALSTAKVTLETGADGARPHRHDHSAEMFYVLDGSLQVLSGTEVVTANRGDFLVVPPGLAHAFAAARSRSAELLIVIAPGVERFEYFRTRIAKGEERLEALRNLQDLYDTHFLSSSEWEAARTH